MTPLPAYLRPANTLASIEAGAAAGARNPLNYLGAMEGGASAGARRASLETSHAEALARNALEAQAQANSMKMAADRNANEMARAKMQSEAQQKAHDQQAMDTAQRIKIEGDYKEGQLSLGQQKINAAAEVASAKASEAANLFSDQQSYANEVAAGAAPEKAIWNHPRLLNPGTRNTLINQSKPPIPRFDTISRTTETPAVPAVPAHKEGGFFGFGGREVPAVPGKLKERVTRTEKVPITEKTVGEKSIPDISPLPKAKDELKPDTIYQTARGPAKWDGNQFNPIVSAPDQTTSPEDAPPEDSPPEE